MADGDDFDEPTLLHKKEKIDYAETMLSI